MPTDMVDGDSDAPVRLVVAVVFTLPGLHQGLDVGAIEVAPHDPHTFAIAPVQLAIDGVEMKLLGGVGASAGNDRGAVASVEVHTFDRAVVGRRHPHIGPVDVAGLHIDCDTIGDGASGDEVGLVGAVGVDGEQPSVAAGFEHEQLSGCISHRCGPFDQVVNLVSGVTPARNPQWRMWWASSPARHTSRSTSLSPYGTTPLKRSGRRMAPTWRAPRSDRTASRRARRRARRSTGRPPLRGRP